MTTTDRHAKRVGAGLAGAIALAWLIAALTVTGLAALLNSGIALVAGLVATGALAAIPIAAAAGWRLGPTVATGSSNILSMSILVVAGTCLLIATGMGLVMGGLTATDHLPRHLLELGESVARACGAFVGMTALAFIYGIIVFGVPGLAIAAPSAIVWEILVRRRLHVRHEALAS